MEIINQILDILQAKIKKGLEQEFNSEINTYIVKDDDSRICVVVSAKDNAAVFCAIDQLGTKGMIDLINKVSGLTWKAEGEKIMLDDGYIVFSDEITYFGYNSGCIELYCQVSNDKTFPGQMFEAIQYVDGKINQSIDWEPNCECDISFQQNLKGE